MKRSTVGSLISVLVLIPATLMLGRQLSGKGHYLTSTLVIIEVMLPFFLRFESRRPQARELVILAVMSALAVASRVAFAFWPNFKPTTAIIMITGIAFGPEAGFLTGAVTAFASNFFFSQGPWTPWQMMAYGMGGFLSGIVFRRGVPRRGWLLTVYGFAAIMLVVGPLLDLCSAFTGLTTLSVNGILAVLLSGMTMNLMHATSCAASMLLLTRPLLTKLTRLKQKYGMLEPN